MATMISEVYDALMEAGASQEKARKAAEALANYESRFSKIDADLLLLKWMTGFVFAGVSGLVIKAFVVSSPAPFRPRPIWSHSPALRQVGTWWIWTRWAG